MVIDLCYMLYMRSDIDYNELRVLAFELLGDFERKVRVRGPD